MRRKSSTQSPRSELYRLGGLDRCGLIGRTFCMATSRNNQRHLCAVDLSILSHTVVAGHNGIAR